MASEHQIRIAKLTDRDLVEKWMTLAKELGVSTVTFLMGDAPLFRNIPTEADESNTDYQELRTFLELDGSDLGARLSLAGHRVDYRRDTPFDFLLATLPDPNKPQLAATTQIFGALKKHFERVDLNESLMELFDDDLKRYYQQREAGLIRLEQLSEKLIKDNEAYRSRIDTEKDEYKEAVDSEYRAKREALDQREEQLDERQEEMDLADAKSTRRKMRQSILDKLKPQGVMSLNRGAMIPIHVLLISVSLLFLTFGVAVIRAPGFDPLELTHAVKLSLASVGFVGTLMLYYRWMDSWLRKGVDENLRLRQLGIDVDRSTWLVEVLSELKSETGASIPDDVLSALTRNLFTERGATSGVTHPTEDILAALLGSSREVELDLPGGKVRIDGRGIRKVTKTVEAQGDD